MEELLGRQGINAVTIGDKMEIIGKFFKVPESHAHCHDARANTPVIGHPVADDGALSRVHNEPDIVFDSADFYIRFISRVCIAGLVVIIVNKWFDTQSSGFAVAGDLLVRYLDVIQVLECLRCLTQGKAEVYMERQAQGHDMGVEFTESEGGSILGEGVEIHLKKIHRELTVDVVELVFVLAVVFFQMLLVDVLQVMEVIRALRVYALVDDKMLAVFLSYKGVAAVGAAQRVLPGEAVFRRREGGVADLALNLSLAAIVAVEVRLWSVAGRAATVFGNITFLPSRNRLDLLVVLVLKVRNEKLPVPVILAEADAWQDIRFEFLVLRGMGIIESPLFERDVSADKINQPAILLIKVLNYSE